MPRIRNMPFAALLVLAFAFVVMSSAHAQNATFRVLAFWTTDGEVDHSDFARQAIEFFSEAAGRDHFQFRATTDWKEMNPETLARMQVVVWLNGQPNTAEEGAAFEGYMNHGGGWLGTHVSGYNDRSTTWRWFVDFLGGAVFFANNWPPLPATLHVDDPTHPVVKGLPRSFLAPANEWYVWKPSARANPDVKVLLTLDRLELSAGLQRSSALGGLSAGMDEHEIQNAVREHRPRRQGDEHSGDAHALRELVAVAGQAGELGCRSSRSAGFPVSSTRWRSHIPLSGFASSVTSEPWGSLEVHRCIVI